MPEVTATVPVPGMATAESGRETITCDVTFAADGRVGVVLTRRIGGRDFETTFDESDLASLMRLLQRCTEVIEAGVTVKVG
jgi:hypothetical protein